MEPPGNFKLISVHAGVAYVSGHPAISGTRILAEGVVGRDLTLEQGYDAARQAALSILASLKQELGDLDRVTRWLRAVGYVQHENVDQADYFNAGSSQPVELANALPRAVFPVTGDVSQIASCDVAMTNSAGSTKAPRISF